MSTDVATIQPPGLAFTAQQVSLIKRTICTPKGREATNDELALFVGQAKRTGLDPFSRQIYAVFRWDGRAQQEKMTIQASIDGLRLVAERSGHYLGQVGPFWRDEGTDWTDVWFKQSAPKAAKVVVRKLIAGQVAETGAVAHWDEYVVTDKGGTPSSMWKSKPALMLAKCAEALALRKAFPNDMSGLYTAEEMSQADADVQLPPVAPVSDVPADVSGFTVAAAQEAPEAAVEADAVEHIDPAYASALYDKCSERLATVGQLKDLLEGVGYTTLPWDLRSWSKDVRLAVLSDLSPEQAALLEAELDAIA